MSQLNRLTIHCGCSPAHFAALICDCHTQVGVAISRAEWNVEALAVLWLRNQAGENHELDHAHPLCSAPQSECTGGAEFQAAAIVEP